MDTRLSTHHKQGGAVAVMLALCLVALVGFMGLAIDLSRLYDRQTELQNLADTAALAGAKELNGTRAGITAAVSKAQAYFQHSAFSYGAPSAPPGTNGLTLDSAAITFSDSPDTADAGWQSAGTAQGNPASIFFMKVDTSANSSTNNVDTLTNYFMQAASAALTTTSGRGRAVAGRFALQITPLGICALNTLPSAPFVHIGVPNELMEFGYRRGLSYDLMNIDPLGFAAVKYMLDPIDVASGPGDTSCNPANNSANTAKPFVCAGTSNIITALPGWVFVNTGMNSTLNREFNSRFVTVGNQHCTVPPDANIQQYPAPSAQPGTPQEWMSPAPTQQGVTLTGIPATQPFYLTQPAVSAADWGPLWSYSRPAQFLSPSTSYATSDWAKLYPVTAGSAPSATSYPSTPASPYAQTSGDYFQAGMGERNRRVLNIAIVDCSTYTPAPACSTIHVLGVGKFFMTVPANIPANLFVEFAGLLSPDELAPTVRLYQ